MSAARSLARGAGTAALFVMAAAGGLVAHMDAPAVRRAIVTRVNVVLASVVAGRIVIDRVGTLGPTHLDGADAHVDDAEGKTVLRATGVTARFSTWELLRSLVGGGDVHVGIDELSVASADVSLDPDDSGRLRLERAFLPRGPAGPPSSGGGGVRLRIPHALLAHASVHGQPPGGPPIDADVDGTDASLTVWPGALALDVAHAQVVARNLPAGVTTRGAVDARLTLPAADGTDLFASASWRGWVGEIAGTAEATYDAGRVDAVLDLPAARPECVRALWASCPFGEATSAHAEAHGPLHRLGVTARAGVGRGAITVFGTASLGDETRASLHVTATTVDAHALSPFAPTTDLAASGDVMLVATAAGAAGGVVTLELAGGTVDGTRVPAETLTGQFERDPVGALRAQANMAVHEPGAPAIVTLRLTPAGSSFELAFDASVDVPRLDGVPRLGPVARGRAWARAHGTIDLGTSHLDARFEASVASVELGGVRLRTATLTGLANGRLALPWVDARVVGGDLSAGPLRFDTLQARVNGPPTSAPVTVSAHGHGVDFFAQATVGLRGGTSLRGLLVTAERNGESARAEASVVRFAPHVTSIEDLEVTGVGSPIHATVRATPGALLVQARSKGVDLARIGRIAGVNRMNGRVSFDVDAALQAKSAQGHIALDLSQGTLAGWHDAQAHVEATLDGLRVAGHVTASAGGVGTLDVSSSSLQLGQGGPLEASSWRTAWGEIDFNVHVDLAKLAAQLPKGTIPVGRPSGTVDVKGRVERDSASDDTPEVDVTAGTKDLALTGSPVPWRIDGIGAAVHAHVDGRTGATSVEVRLADTVGPLVAVQASSGAVPYARMFTSDQPMRSALLAMPLVARVTLPPRDLGKLPAFLGTHGMHGTLAADVDWRGSVDKPSIDARVTLSHGHAEVTVLSLPVDLAVAAHYDGTRADASVIANAHGAQVLAVDGRVDVRVADLLGGWELPWKASAHGTLTGFPLQSLAALDDRQVRGKASGTFELDGLHENARAKVALTLDALQVGEVRCRPTTVNATVDGHSADASARIAESDGFAEARAHVGSTWGKALAPSVDPSQPIDVFVTASHFRAALLLPFVSKLFSELDGRIDANARLQIDPAAKTMKPEGTISLTGGVLELSAMGSELHDASAKITMTPDGVVRLESASARGLSGRIEAAGSARFQGMELVGARGLVQVPSKDPIPLVVDGAQVGMLDGRMDLTLDRAADGLDVKVDVPRMRLQLPTASKHDVQALGSLKAVRVGIGNGPDGGFVPVTLDAGDAEVAPATGPVTPMRVTVHLGSDVEVKRGSDLDVRMEGTPMLTIADRVTASGQISLTRGTLNVQGKTFTIEKGIITFVDDPTNPQVVLSASWPAPPPESATIYAEFVGPLKTGKVTLRSDPPLSNDKIISLLLYGTEDQQGGSGGAGSPQLGAASGVAGSAASSNVNRALGGVNRALDNIGLGQSSISTNLDTSQTTPRPEVEVQIARDISFQVAWVLGVPPPGSNPDQTLFTIRWRFLRQWQVETTVGDAGTSILDLVWQRRY